MIISKQVLTKSGAAYIDHAVDLARRKFPARGEEKEEDRTRSTTRRVLDGYLLIAKRTSMTRGKAIVFDAPALITCGGDAFYAALLLPAPVIQLPRGRDTFLPEDPPADIPVAALVPPLLVAGFYEGINLGPAPVGVVSYRLGTFGGYPLESAGCTAVDMRVVLGGEVPSTPLAYVKPTDELFGQVTVHAPTLYRGVTAEGVDITYSPDAPTAPAAAWTARVNESLLFSLTGALFVCKRTTAPAYGAGLSSEDIGFANAQAPWLRSRPVQVFADETGAVYDFVVLAHCVRDQRQDLDRNGARCLWVSTYRYRAGEVLLLGSYVHDTRGGPVNRAPYLNVADNVYTTNAHPYAEVVRLDDGTLLVLDFFTTFVPVAEPGTGYENRRTVELMRFSPAAALQGTDILQDGLLSDGLTTAEDMFFPVGGDTDGTTAVFVVFHTNNISTAGTTTLSIVEATAAGGSVALQVETTLRRIGGHRAANGVTYIGNGKYLFLVSSALAWDGIPGNQQGDWSVATYDANAGTVALTGTVDATLRPYGAATAYHRGRVDCVRYETEDHPATLIATTGGPAAGGLPGGEVGATYISLDSGATWAKVADYGSSQGAFYCGNIMQPRSEPPVKV